MLISRESELSAQNSRLVEALVVLEAKVADMEAALAGQKALEAQMSSLEAALADKATIEARLVAMEMELAKKTAEVAKLEPLEAALAEARAQVVMLEARIQEPNASASSAATSSLPCAIAVSEEKEEVAHRMTTRPASVDAAEAMMVLQGGSDSWTERNAAMTGVETGQTSNIRLVAEQSVSRTEERVSVHRTNPSLIANDKAVGAEIMAVDMSGPSSVSVPREASRIPDPRSLAERFAALAAKERQLREKERMVSELLAQLGAAGRTKNKVNSTGERFVYI
jgi:hypothetical protein